MNLKSHFEEVNRERELFYELKYLKPFGNKIAQFYEIPSFDIGNSFDIRKHNENYSVYFSNVKPSIPPTLLPGYKKLEIHSDTIEDYIKRISAELIKIPLFIECRAELLLPGLFSSGFPRFFRVIIA